MVTTRSDSVRSVTVAPAGKTDDVVYNSPIPLFAAPKVRPTTRAVEQARSFVPPMPTLNNDSTAVAVNPVDELSKMRSRRIVGVSLGATLITLLVLFAAMALAPADANAANTCTLTSTQPITLWGDTTKWSGCGGTYPGQGAGDTAVVTLGGGYTLKIDAFNNPVILQISGSASSIPIQVATGGTLTLETSSSATSSNTFTVDSGGTMGTNTGANVSG